MKRYISFLLAVVISCTTLLIPAVGEEPATTEPRYTQEISFLEKLEILPANFDTAKMLTRAGFLELVTNVILSDVDYSSLNGAGSIFADVDEGHPYYQRILACKNLNLIKGDENNYFYPDREITLIEALTIFLNTLSYTVYANAAGGYPTGYYNVSRDIGLTNGLSKGYHDKLDGTTGAKLLYNALFADLAVVDSTSQDGVHITIYEGRNYLSEKMGIMEYDARVTDNGIASVNGSSFEDFQRVMLTETKTGNNIIAYHGDCGIEQYLGYRVKVFVRNNEETGRDEVIHFNLHKAVRETVIPSSKIIHTSDNYIEYEIDENTGRYSKVSLASPPDVLYNGVYLNVYDHTAFAPMDGFVRLVDNDGDGRCELVDVVSFNYNGSLSQQGNARNIVVDSVDVRENMIYCKFNADMNLDLDEDVANYQMRGDCSQLSQLGSMDIVSVAQAPSLVDGKQFYLLFVTKQTVKGILESISLDADELTVDGVTYKASSSILGIKPNFLKRLAFDSEIELRLDAAGKAAYIDGMTGGLKNYAYLIGAMLDDGLDNALKIKVFTKDEEIKILEVSSKALIDGKKYESSQQQLDALRMRPEGSTPIDGAPAYGTSLSRPIILEINGKDLVSSVDTDNPNYATNENADNQYTNQVHIGYSDEEAEDEKALKAAFRAPRVSKYRKSSRSVDGKFVMNNDTVVLSVPDIDWYGLDQYSKYAPNKDAAYNQAFNYELIKLYEDSLEDENYEVLSTASLNSSYAYDIQAYDIDPDTGTAGLVVIRGRRDPYLYQTVQTNLPMAVFLRTATVYDEAKKKIITKLYYTQDGVEELSATADPDDLLFSYKNLIYGCDASATPYGVAVPALRKGDIIRIIVAQEQISHLERVYRLSDVKSTMCSNLYPTNSRFLYGTVASAGIVMPNDVRNYWGGFSQSYTLGIAYPQKLIGNSITAVVGLNTLNDIDFDRPASYSDQYFNVAGAKIVTIDRREGSEPKVSQGSLADIDTLERSGMEGSSILLYKHVDYQFDQLFILNGYGEDQ